MEEKKKEPDKQVLAKNDNAEIVLEKTNVIIHGRKTSINAETIKTKSLRSKDLQSTFNLETGEIVFQKQPKLYRRLWNKLALCLPTKYLCRYQKK